MVFMSEYVLPTDTSFDTSESIDVGATPHDVWLSIINMGTLGETPALPTAQTEGQEAAPQPAQTASAAAPISDASTPPHSPPPDQPATPVTQDESPVVAESLASAVAQFDSGDDTPADLANRVEELIAAGRAPESLREAIDAYRADAKEDFEELGGRGDMDAAEEKLIAAVRAAAGPGAATEAAPVAKAVAATIDGTLDLSAQASGRLQELTGDGSLRVEGLRYRTGSAEIAGPFSTSPVGANRDPWHGQSHDFSTLFHSTMHLRCVHTADFSVTLPS